LGYGPAFLGGRIWICKKTSTTNVDPLLSCMQENRHPAIVAGFAQERGRLEDKVDKPWELVGY